LRSKNLTKKRYKFCQAVQVLLIGRFNQEKKGLAKESKCFAKESKFSQENF
jgi:hypothetical protein